MERVGWDSPLFDLDPAAPAVGPFPHADFLHVLWEEEARGELVLAGSDAALIALAVVDGSVVMVGDPDLTDYHSPLGTAVDSLVEKTALAVDGTEWDLDSIPGEAVEPLVAGLERAGLTVEVSPHDVAAVVQLPNSFDDYLALIGKKERHEFRRKRRRYEEAVGELAHETHRGAGWGFDEFVRLHRLAAGEKGGFMGPARERIFRRLTQLPGWRIDLLRVPGTDRAAAAVFGYSDPDGYYLYNSSYDPDVSEGSPGMTLLGVMVERAIGEGLRRFDFLKGDEAYKYRMGATDRPLYRVRAT